VDQGAEVVCLVRDWVPRSELLRSGTIERVNVVRGDICDRDTVERAIGEYETTVVIHVAAQAIVGIANRNPISTFESNIRGTWTVLEACRRSPGVRSIVIASSDKAYGSHDKLPYTEDAPLAGRFPYDVSKACADMIAQSYACTYDLPVAVTRCGNFYGGGDLNWNRIVPSAIRSLLRGERPVIRSDGSYVRDYFYVEDGAAAYLLLAEQLFGRPELRGKAFNFSNETEVTVMELVSRIVKAMGTDLEPLVLNEATCEIPRQSLCAARARTLLGWSPLFTLDEGLERTIAWYREFLA
jgi:CDP-glucose 4,6-dehydratase